MAASSEAYGRIYIYKEAADGAPGSELRPPHTHTPAPCPTKAGSAPHQGQPPAALRGPTAPQGSRGERRGGGALPDRPTPHCRLRAGRRRGREEEKGGEGRRGAGPAVRAERAAGGCPSNSCGGSGLQTVPRAPAPPPSPGSGGTAGGRPRSPPSLLAPTSGCRPGRRLRRR